MPASLLIREAFAFTRTFDTRFDAVDTRSDAVDTRFDAVGTRSDAVEYPFLSLYGH